MGRVWCSGFVACLAYAVWNLVATVVSGVRRDGTWRQLQDAYGFAEHVRTVVANEPGGPTWTVTTRAHRFVEDGDLPRLMLSDRVWPSTAFFVLDAPEDATVCQYYLVRDPNPKRDEIVRTTGVTVAGPGWGRSGAEVQRGQGGTRRHRHPAGVTLIPMTLERSRLREGLR